MYTCEFYQMKEYVLFCVTKNDCVQMTIEINCVKKKQEQTV